MFLLQAIPPPAPVVASSVDPTLIAAAIVTVLAALAAAVTTIINAMAAVSDRREAKVARTNLVSAAADTNAKADTIIGKTIEIHTLTNSNLQAVTAALAVANEKIVGLEKQMAQLVTSAAEATKVRDGTRRATDTGPVQVEVVNTPLAVTSTEPPT